MDPDFEPNFRREEKVSEGKKGEEGGGKRQIQSKVDVSKLCQLVLVVNVNFRNTFFSLI